MVKKLKENKPILIVIGLLLLVGVSTLGRFIYLEIKKNFFTTESFYFNSDKLREGGTTYQINNYNGVDNYDIVINMNSIKNEILKASSDISYNISYTCSEKTNCSVSKNSGIIYSASSTDYFTATLAPNTNLETNDEISIEITASSTSPYKKTLSAAFVLVVGDYGLSYEIYDEIGNPYIEFRMTNTLDYYTVLEAFGSHNIDDRIDINTYLGLSDADKNKCASAIINLEFDPDDLIFDNASIVRGLISTNTTVINGHDYIYKLSFKVDAISSNTVRFYKTDKSKNYTYPIVNNTPILTVTYG